jgi:hypothetical protein
MALPHYARHFQAMGAPPASVGLAEPAAAQLATRLHDYDAVEEPVVRVLSHRALPDILAVARAAIGA